MSKERKGVGQHDAEVVHERVRRDGGIKSSDWSSDEGKTFVGARSGAAVGSQDNNESKRRAKKKGPQMKHTERNITMIKDVRG